MAASRSIGQDAGELPETMSKGAVCIDLVQVMREVDLRQATSNLNTHGPEGHFMTHVKDLILAAALTPACSASWQPL